MADDILKQAKADYGHLTVKELLLLTAYRTSKLEERVNVQNGRIGKLELKTWLVVAVVAAIIGEGILKVFAF